MSNTSIDLKILREKLASHWGAKTEVANRANVTREMVRLVLNGKRNNLAIVEIAAEVLLEREKQTASRKRNITELISAIEKTF